MKKRLLAFCSSVPLACCMAVSAQAQEDDAFPVSGSFALTSDYIFRGTTQTNRKPALQGGVQYDHASGFYAGVWGSNVSWLSDAADEVSSSVELDAYAGFSSSFGDSDFGYDVGVLRYFYPGRYPDGFVSPNTTEVYAAISWTDLTLKYSYALTNTFGWADSKHSDYIELNYSLPFAEVWTLDAHVGRQTIDGTRGADYTDWKIGIGYDFGHGFSLAAAYVDTNADKDYYTNAYGKYLGKQTGVLTLTKSF
ncbi:TorF family putative porin [Dokdonella koreensis]|uniref:Gcw_chp domain containing protein n=1 Tax=Dokdonella koreensis DS-123 TaxID=1300342 RepID=A0A167G6V8_9GAMM|nr:TorF family putative porin [Dokdonella koreensis]ANB16216.1 Gcw_chp domain containing protein [Dokdonella koreensis DS-123]